MDANNEREAVKPEDETALKKFPIGRYALASISVLQDGKIQYGCKECPVKHTDKEFVEHHLYLHYNEYRFLCGICGVGLKRKEHLERHTQGHLEVRPHSCPDCGKAFKRKEHLNIHRSIHSGDKSMYCTVCKKSFYRKDHLQKHIQTHSKIFTKNNKNLIGEKGDVAGDFKQDDDNSQDSKVHVKQEFIHVDYEEKPILPEELPDDSEEEIKMEIDESYEDSPVHITPDSPAESLPASPVSAPSEDREPRRFACTLCDKRFKRRDHLKVHSFTHMKKENGCDECGKAFHSPELLLDHVSRVHGDDCDNDPDSHLPVEAMVDTMITPDLPFLPDNSLLVPREYQPPDERPHECHVCHRKFKRRQHLKVHANVHLKLQPTIWCSLCDVGFYDNNQFEGHQCIDNSQTSNNEASEAIGDETSPQDTPKYDARKENNFPIEFIGVEENIKILDETRLYMQPEEVSIPIPLRVYVCKFCSKPFKRKDHYRIHLNIHTGVKSFFCPHCQKGFYRKDHMKKHALIHDKPKPQLKNKTKKQIPDLYPIDRMPKFAKNNAAHSVKPEITIHAPSNTKLRVPLSIKVPYKMVMSLDNGEQRAVTVDPHAQIPSTH